MSLDFTKHNLNNWLYFQDTDGKSKHLPKEELKEMSLAQYNQWVNFIPKLESFKTLLKKHLNIDLTPDIITSSFRCKARNDKAGSSDKSLHLTGCALDIKDTNLTIKNWLLSPSNNEIYNTGLYFIVDYSKHNIVHIQDKPFSDKSKIVYSQASKQFLL